MHIKYDVSPVALNHDSATENSINHTSFLLHLLLDVGVQNSNCLQPVVLHPICYHTPHSDYEIKKKKRSLLVKRNCCRPFRGQINWGHIPYYVVDRICYKTQRDIWFVCQFFDWIWSMIRTVDNINVTKQHHRCGWHFQRDANQVYLYGEQIGWIIFFLLRWGWRATQKWA